MTVDAAYFIQISQTIFVAMYSVCLWDWLTSLPREWRLVWKSRWSTVKVLYLLCRYWVICVIPYILWVFLTNHSEPECQKLFRSPVYLATWNMIWAECVLMFRAYAFLGNKLPVLAGFIGLLCAVATYQFWVITTQIALLPFDDPFTGPCFPTVKYTGSPHIMLFFVVALVYDTIVTLLTLFGAWQLRSQFGGGRLLKTFVAEGLYYFVLISGSNLLNAIFYWQRNQSMSAMHIPFSVILPDVLACRMILGLRERGIGHTSGYATSGSLSHSARKIAGGSGPLTPGSKPTTPGTAPSSSAAAYFPPGDIGVMTASELKHELTNFHHTQRIAESDIMTMPYKSEDAQRSDYARTRVGIRIDVDDRKYYEGGSDAESDHRKSNSFVP